MKRAFLALVVAGWCVVPAAHAQVREEKVYSAKELVRPDDGRMRPALRLSPIRALLLKRVDQVSWTEQPLRDVVDWMKVQSAESGKVNVVLAKALSAQSIDADTTVTLEMSDSTVAQVLNEVLDQISDIDPITYVGMGNTLRISTKSDVDKTRYTRIYNIDDIFFEIKNFRGSPQIDLNQRQQSGGGGGGGNGQAQVQSIFGNSGGGGGNDDDEEEEDDARAEKIKEWIRTTVKPETWDNNGGEGKLEVFNKQLAIHNTLEVHELLGGPFHIGE